jgi:hypothetical protein
MPESASFFQELNLWRRLWIGVMDKPDSIEATLLDDKTCHLMYPDSKEQSVNITYLTSSDCQSSHANPFFSFFRGEGGVGCARAWQVS